MRTQVLKLELQQVEQVSYGGTVDRGVLADRRVVFWIREVVPAAIGQGRESPVPFDELDDRDVIGVVVRNVTGFGEPRNHQQGDARAIAEVIERLNVTGVIVTAAFVKGDEDRGALPQLGIRLNTVDDLFHETFKEIEFGRRRVTIHPSAGLDEGNCR